MLAKIALLLVLLFSITASVNVLANDGRFDRNSVPCASIPAMHSVMTRTDAEGIIHFRCNNCYTETAIHHQELCLWSYIDAIDSFHCCNPMGLSPRDYERTEWFITLDEILDSFGFARP